MYNFLHEQNVSYKYNEVFDRVTSPTVLQLIYEIYDRICTKLEWKNHTCIFLKLKVQFEMMDDFTNWAHVAQVWLSSFLFDRRERVSFQFQHFNVPRLQRMSVRDPFSCGPLVFLIHIDDNADKPSKLKRKLKQ